MSARKLSAHPQPASTEAAVSSSPDVPLAERIVQRVEDVLAAAEQGSKPLEIEPARSALFELFVTAEGAGYVVENGPVDLTADGLCRSLSERWGLKQAAQDAFRQQTKLPTDQLGRIRLLWALLRMWMEWTYAWQRWPEFHPRDAHDHP